MRLPKMAGGIPGTKAHNSTIASWILRQGFLLDGAGVVVADVVVRAHGFGLVVLSKWVALAGPAVASTIAC